jgi:hypothetical protein
MNKLKRPPYNSDLYLKKDISGSFWKDSNDLLWRSKIFRRHIPHDNLSTKSKVYVDLVMAIECSLKSMIVTLSLKSETPEAAYLVARRCSHHLDKLYAEVQKRARNRVKLLGKDEEKVL